jgi:hypothetical protein
VHRLMRPLALALLVIAFTASIALAAINFHSGPTVTFNDNNASATATWNFSGLGNEDVSAQLVLDGYATYTCRNKGGKAAPGQNPVPAQSVSPIKDLSNAEKNGRTDVTVSGSLTAPATLDPQTVGCPNPAGTWTVNRDSLVVTGATLYIFQPSGDEPNNQIYSQFFDNPNN